MDRPAFSYMVSLRAAKADATLGPPRYLKLDATGAVVAQMPVTAWRKDLLAGCGKNAQGQPAGDLLLFVHGFNVSFDHARAGDVDNLKGLAAAGWKGVYVSYDWPSFGDVLDYYKDRSNARASANGFIDTVIALFVRLLDPDCDLSVGVMAHSMGAFVVREAFTWAHQDTKTNSKSWSVSQLILVAGDVSQGSLSKSQPGGEWISTYVGRTTCYSNRFDSVLQVSDLKNGEPTPRTGRVGLPIDAPASFCNVDTSALFSSLPLDLAQQVNPATPHCYYFGRSEFWRDAVLTLSGGIDRHAIPTRIDVTASGGPDRFTLRTDAYPDDKYAVVLRLANPDWSELKSGGA